MTATLTGSGLAPSQQDTGGPVLHRSITIAIASAGRTTLADTLMSLKAMVSPAAVSIDVIVADDDPQGAATTLVAATFGTSLGDAIAIDVLKVGARNISHARNACLEAARGDLVAFVDDDEWVAPDWLTRMLDAIDEFSADCVFGPVHPQYPPGTPDWIVSANPLHVDWGRRGRIVTTGRSGNVLMRRDVIIASGIRFEPALGRSGGEDTQFFHRLHQAGARLVVTDDALIHEHVPAARLLPSHLKARAMRSGQTYAAILGPPARDRLSRLLFGADAAFKCAVAFSLSALLRPLDRARALRLRQKGWSNAGKLRHLAGRALPQLY